MTEKKMDVQREEKMKRDFMVPQLLLISEFTQIHFSSYQLRSPGSSSSPFSAFEHSRAPVLHCINRQGRNREKVKEKFSARNWLMPNGKKNRRKKKVKVGQKRQEGNRGLAMRQCVVQEGQGPL